MKARPISKYFKENTQDNINYNTDHSKTSAAYKRTLKINNKKQKPKLSGNPI